LVGWDRTGAGMHHVLLGTHLHLAEGHLVRERVVGPRGRHDRLGEHAGHVLGGGVAGGLGPGCLSCVRVVWSGSVGGVGVRKATGPQQHVAQAGRQAGTITIVYNPLSSHTHTSGTHPVTSAPRARRAVRLLVLLLLRIIGVAGWLAFGGSRWVHQRIDDGSAGWLSR